jgi:hypothetical protein
MSSVLTASLLCPSGTVSLTARGDLCGIRLMRSHGPMLAAASTYVPVVISDRATIFGGSGIPLGSPPNLARVWHGPLFRTASRAVVEVSLGYQLACLASPL